MVGLHRDLVLGPQPADRDQIGLETARPLRPRHAERLELNIAIAKPDTEDHLPTRDYIKRREFLGDVKRRQQRQQQDPGVEPKPRRLGGKARQHRDKLQHLKWISAVVRGLGDGVETEAIGEADDRQGLLKATGDVLSLLRLPANDEPELELRGHQLTSRI